MPQAIGIVDIGGTSPLTTGITATSTGNAIVGLNPVNDVMFQSGVIGVSVTHLNDIALVPSWAIEVQANVGGADYLIAGVTGLGSTTSSLVAILPNNVTDVDGTTEFAFVGGIPRPTSVDIIGSSTSVGTTFGAIVTMHLFNPD